MFIDDTKIPEGFYCYSEQGLCPYYSHEVIALDVEIPYCLYLEKGDLTGLTEEEFDDILLETGLTADELFKEHPLDILWDQCKECGVNDY